MHILRGMVELFRDFTVLNGPGLELVVLRA